MVSSDAIKDACLELDEHGEVVLRSPLEVRAVQKAYPKKTQAIFNNGWWTVKVMDTEGNLRLES